MPKLTIIRGLPGSGKSTRARELAAERGIMHIEPDFFCMRGGKYIYDESYFDEAVREALNIVKSFGMFGADIIFSDVLPRRQDVLQVIQAYESAYWDDSDLTVSVIDLPGGEQHAIQYNRHGVRPEDIHRMASAWEPWL